MAKKPVDNSKANAKELERLQEIVEWQNNMIERQRVQIENLHHQAIGYDAVIDFLWTKGLEFN